MSPQIHSEIIEFFKKNGRLRHFVRGQTILSGNDHIDETYLIVEGVVKVKDIDEEGNARIISVSGQGHIFPAPSLFTVVPKQLIYFYEAFTKTSCLIVGAKDFKKFIHSRPELAQSLLDYILTAYRNQMVRVISLQNNRVSDGLDASLVYLAARIGDREKELSYINAPITHQDLAELVGVSRGAITQAIQADGDKPRCYKQKGGFYIDLSRVKDPSLFERYENTVL